MSSNTEHQQLWTPAAFVLDVDGVMTTGQFLYSEAGKSYKVFGPDDADGLALVRDLLTIHFVSSDKRGFPISYKRISEDMGYPLDLVGSAERADWIAERYPVDRTIYMGDGFFDQRVFSRVGYGIAPAASDPMAMASADYVCRRRAAERAVAEACVHIIKRFFSTSGKEVEGRDY
ncbi:MAG: hypothetical protein ABW168_28375 [Sedimenticola sp.]